MNAEKSVQARIKRFANTSKLPSLPEVALRLIEIAQQPDPDSREVARVIRSDPAVTEKILKTVNSALFAFRPKVETVEQAVPKLGVTMIRTLILSFHLSSHQFDEPGCEEVYQDLWRCCLTQAVFAELIAEHTGNDPAVCFMAGMLQDIGILAMLSESPNEYVNHVLSTSSFPNVSAAERDYFGFSHIDVSIEKVKQWNMGKPLIDAIQHHHDKVSSPTAGDLNLLRPILQAANLGADLVLAERSTEIRATERLKDLARFLDVHFKIQNEQLDELMTDVHERVSEYSVIFNFDIGQGLGAEYVISQAKDIIQEIALKSQLDLLQKNSPSKKRNPKEDELYQDCMTGLNNRRFVNEQLTEQLERWVERRRSISLLFLDVDKFKAINDTYGHKVGDQAIRHVAQWLQKSTRKTDHVVRLGGDEFLVIMQVDEALSSKIALRIAEEIPPMKVPQINETLPISLSVGCVFYQPDREEETLDLNWLIDQADQLMYRAKRNDESNLSYQKIEGRQSLTGACS